MTFAISAAEPSRLLRYSEIATRIDQELIIESNHLSGVLRRFEATCTESGYSIPVSGIANSIRSYAQHKLHIDYWVRDVGVGFQTADESAAIIEASDVIEFIKKANHVASILMPILSGTAIITSIHAGTTYSGQIIINLPQYLKYFGFNLRSIRQWAGLSAYLNHIKYTNIPSHFARIGLITAVPIVLAQWAVDFTEYEGTALPSAMTVDAVLGLTPVAAGFAGAKAGALLGAAIGSVVPGVGTVIGGAVGAIAGGVIASVGATYAIHHFDVREQSIPWVDRNVFERLAKGISRGVNLLDEIVDAAAQRLRSQFDEVMRAAQIETHRLQRDILRGVADIKSMVTGTIFNLRNSYENSSVNLNQYKLVTPLPGLPTPKHIIVEKSPVPWELVSDEGVNWYGNTEFAYKNRHEYYAQLQGLHSGIDLLVPHGTQVVNPINRIGTVVSINGVPFNFGANDPGSVLVDYGDYLVLYGHTIQDGLKTKIDDKIEPGAPVAKVGTPSGGPAHLHLEFIPKLPEWDNLSSDQRTHVRPGDIRTNPIPFFDPELRKLMELKDWDTFHPTQNGEWMTSDEQPDIYPGKEWLFPSEPI